MSVTLPWGDPPRPALDLHPTYKEERYTFSGLFAEEARAVTNGEAAIVGGDDALVVSVRAPDGTPLYGVLTRHLPAPQPRAGIPHAHTSDWDYVRIVTSVFRRIERVEAPTRWYKPLEVEKVRDVGERVQWGGTVLDVATHLLTLPIIKHGLPNANHRTNLYVTRLYLRSQGIRWPIYNLHGHGRGRFLRDANAFIVESKYLLFLLRRRPLARVAFDHGWHGIRIGPRRFHAMEAADLAQNSRELQRRHRAAARALLLELASEKEQEKMMLPAQGGREGFTRFVLGD